MNRLAATAKHELLQGEHVMARKSFQDGTLEEKGGKLTLRYRERVPNTIDRWIHRRFDLDKVLNGCRDRKAIKDAVRTKMAIVNDLNNSLTPSPELTFKGFVEGLWKMYMSTQDADAKPSTLYMRESILRSRIMPTFGQKRLMEVTPGMLTEFFANLQTEHSPGYSLNVYIVLANILESAVDMDLLIKSPLRPKLHRPKYKRKQKPGLEPDEIQRVLENIRPDFKLFMLLLSVLGLRVGEVLAWRWQDFDEVEGAIWVRGTLWRGEIYAPKTEGSEKLIHLPPVLIDAIRSHRAESAFSQPTDYIFCRADGQPLYSGLLYAYVLYPAMDAAGIKPAKQTHGFHLFRRSASRILYKLTRDPKLVQDFLRHSRISTTMDEYVQDMDSVRDEAVKLMTEKVNFTLTVPRTSETIQ